MEEDAMTGVREGRQKRRRERAKEGKKRKIMKDVTETIT
jgi:hypothetical protein